jgi:alpha-tubulin suppressor-like RCC1 family protein
MTASVVRAVVALSWLMGCSNEFQILEQRVPDQTNFSRDAGLDAAPDATADATIGDARITPREDASMVDATIARDAGVAASLVSGFAHTCALAQGTLYCWGANALGQAGVVGGRDQTKPVKLASEAFVDVCAGERHSCALRADGSTFCWGSNAHGELGLGDLDQRDVPTALDPRRFVALACGGFNTCALAPRGELWCWGDNSEGKLGQNDPFMGQVGSLALSSSPIPVQTDVRFAKVSVGQGHVCALSEQGKLYCWGRNNYGQLGVSTQDEQTRTPQPVVGETQYVSIAAGQFHSCATDVAGKLWCWGLTKDGLLGVQSAQPEIRVPALLIGDDWDSVSVNWLHSCALKKSGSLFCWGRGEEGQLGGGDSMQRGTPTQVARDAHWRDVTAGQFHSCAFADDGLYCWGANDTGQLGFGDTARHYVPLRVPF